jgi:hypothetical protein
MGFHKGNYSLMNAIIEFNMIASPNPEISIKLKFGSRSEQLASERKGITDQNANPKHS